MTHECKDCGQGHIEEIRELEQRVERLSKTLEASRVVMTAWMGWYHGPYAEGIGYILPPVTKTKEILATIKEGKS